jgi:putative transposase
MANAIASNHKGWVEEYLGDGKKDREEEWTSSIAVGNRPFVEKVKAVLGFRHKGRKITRSGEGYQVRETPARYNALLGAEK